MTGLMKFGGISAVALVSMLLLLINVVPVLAPMIAQHEAHITIDPAIANCDELGNTFTVNVENSGASEDDEILQVEIYKALAGISDFTCGPAPSEWTYLPWPGGDRCIYVTELDSEYKIKPGEDINFTFTATMSSDTCESSFTIVTVDDAYPEGDRDTSPVAVKIDCTPPTLFKDVIGPQVAKVGTCPPTSDNDECWVMDHKTDIVVQVYDNESGCDLGLDYCTYNIYLDGALNYTHTFDPADPEPGIGWQFVFTEDSVHTLEIICEDIAGNKLEDNETFYVDSTPPVTTKSFDGPNKTAENGVEWIDGVTEVVLDAVDPDPTGYGCNISGVETWYKNALAEELEPPHPFDPEQPCWDSDFCQSLVDMYDHCPQVGEWQPYMGPFQKEEESCHILWYYSVDELGNTEDIKVNCFFVDKTPPEMIKEVGEPNITCYDNSLILENKEIGEGDCGAETWKVIDDDIQATVQYHNTGPEFKYKLTLNSALAEDYVLIYYADQPDRFVDWGGAPAFLLGTIEAGETVLESSADSGTLPYDTDWNKNPDPHYCDCNNSHDDYEHCSGAKIWLIPSTDYDGTGKVLKAWNPSEYLFETDLITYEKTTQPECDYWVQDHVTPITLTCTDQEPHPSGDEEVCYKVSYDMDPYDLTSKYCGESLEAVTDAGYEGGWCCVDAPETIIFVEDSLHDLEYFCRDAVNKKSEIDLEWFRVDSQAPIITKTMLGTDHLGDCPPGPNPIQPCYVRDDGVNGVRIDVIDDDKYICAVDEVICSYELWWDQQTGSPVQSGIFDEQGVDIYFQEDSTHTLKIWCEDALGNDVYDEEVFLVDSTPPVTEKTYGQPQKVDPFCAEVVCGYDAYCMHEMCTWWITSGTEVTLSADDEKVGQDYPNTIYWRNLYFPDNDEICQRDMPVGATATSAQNSVYLDYCNPDYYTQFVTDYSMTNPPWNEYAGSFTKPEESCHVIEYYSVDALGNEEIMKWQCVFVDNTPPMSVKEHGEPLVPDSGFDWLTNQTPITLDCDDSRNGTAPHPVGQETLYWRFSKYATGFGDTPEYSTWYSEDYTGLPIQVNFPDDCWHDLEYYCVDHLGNDERDLMAGEPNRQLYIVDTVAPVITKTIVGPSEGTCPPASSADTCYIDGDTEIHVDATDPEPHPVDEVLCTWDYEVYEVLDGNKLGQGQVEITPPFVITFPEESTHILTITCWDALGNEVVDVEKFIVDKTPPEIAKEYDWPRYPLTITEINYPHYINSSTSITVTATDPEPHPSGLKTLDYRYGFVNDENCRNWELCQIEEIEDLVVDWTAIESGNSFTIGEESCHLIEIRAEDNVGKTSTHRQCVFVDNTAPYPDKKVGQPNTKWNGTGSIFYREETAHCWDGTEDEIECWKVTMTTPISLDCIDQPDSHPVDHNTVCYNVEVDGTDMTEKYCSLEQESHYDLNGDGFCCLGYEKEFLFKEETEHNLKYYCVDALGNKGEKIDEEKFKVEGTRFEIPLFKKWNLISVPFVLLNDEPSEVFKDLEGVESVWAYDGDDWYVWTPNPDAPNTLESIEPGWGYWVIETKDETEENEWASEWLIIGGSLLNPGPVVPPSRDLVDGWNLIGYYGTSWELYPWSDFNFVCGDSFEFPDRFIYGDKVYCALNSLADLQVGPKWDSLWSYINCGNHMVAWVGLNACADESLQQMLDRMYAGRGYWIHMDEDDEYVPATTCIWNDDWECVWTGGGIIP